MLERKEAELMEAKEELAKVKDEVASVKELKDAYFEAGKKEFEEKEALAKENAELKERVKEIEAALLRSLEAQAGASVVVRSAGE